MHTLSIKEDRGVCTERERRKRKKEEGREERREEPREREEEKRKGREGEGRHSKRKGKEKIFTLLARQYDCKNLAKHPKSLSLPLFF